MRTRRQLGAHLRHFIIKTSDFSLVTTAQINQLMNESTEAEWSQKKWKSVMERKRSIRPTLEQEGETELRLQLRETTVCDSQRLPRTVGQ